MGNFTSTARIYRYIENQLNMVNIMKNRDKSKGLHPTNRELTDFIDKKLSIKNRGIVIEHLIYCNECSEIAVSIIKKIKKKY